MSHERYLLTLICTRTHGVMGTSAGTLAELQHATGLAPLHFVEAVRTLRTANLIAVSGDGLVQFTGSFPEQARVVAT